MDKHGENIAVVPGGEQPAASSAGHDVRSATSAKGLAIKPAEDSKSEVVILGAGLAGLAAGFVLARQQVPVCVIEGASEVGGLSQTISHGGFLFDLGGHRFLTKNKKIEDFVLDLLRGRYLVVARTSKIYMLKRYFDYPLRPANAIFGLGVATTCHILFDYCRVKLKNSFSSQEQVSLEDWIVSRFGRKMFDLYFKGYSEKVWGIGCRQISKEWIAQRISGLSLWTAIKNAFVKVRGRDILTLTDEFYYPKAGIGEISERLREGIEENSQVKTRTRVLEVNHQQGRITDVVVKNGSDPEVLSAGDFVSSIPLPALVRMLRPTAPADILAAADCLKYRDIIIVTIMLDREQVTNLTWLYLPDEDIPFGRIHEPKNWSRQMAPDGKTHLVVEYFCFRGDAIWNTSDDELAELTVTHLEALDFIRKEDVLDYCILRKPNAYPLFEVGYTDHYEKIVNYLSSFANLHIIGRGGMFRYYNMDHAMESGMEAAEKILAMRDRASAALPN